MAVPKKSNKNSTTKSENNQNMKEQNIPLPPEPPSPQPDAAAQLDDLDPKVKEFRAFVMPMILDQYLDVSEENDSMKKAAHLGLDHLVAQEELERLCEKHGAVLERVAKKKFKEDIRDEVGDKFLDDDEYNDLLQKGLKIFEDAEEPMSMVIMLLDTVLGEENAMSESQFRKEAEKMLSPHVSQGSTITEENWSHVRNTMMKKAEKIGIDTVSNELGAILDSVLEDSGLMIGKGASKGGNSMFMILGVIVALVLAYAMFSGGSEKPHGDPDGGSGGANNGGSAGSTGGIVPPGSAIEIPKCDESCNKELQELALKLNEAVHNNAYTTPVGKSVCSYEKQIEKLCRDFNLLPHTLKAEAAKKYNGFLYCTIDPAITTKVAADYISWANKAKSKGERTCSWVERCLIILPGNEQCTAAANTFKCSIPKEPNCAEIPSLR